MPPPAEVIDEKIESLPLVPATGAGVLPTPPAPTVIGKPAAVIVNAEHAAAAGLAVYGVTGLLLPSLNHRHIPSLLLLPQKQHVYYLNVVYLLLL